MKQKKSTLLADNTQGLITTKVASAAPHPITPAYGKMVKFMKQKKSLESTLLADNTRGLVRGI